MTITYSQKLRDPRWQKKRLHILERDQWRCCSCGDDKSNLQVHHVIYAKKDPWDYSDDCYQTLCDKCHGERQPIIDNAANALKISLKDYPTERLGVIAERMMGIAMESLSSAGKEAA